MDLDPQLPPLLFDYVLQLGDDRLILGHRLSEWCGHAPSLEEDIALANIGLDCLGQSSWLLKLAAEVEGQGRSADDLAFFRDDVDFRNTVLAELPNENFAVTLVRQYFVDAFYAELYSRLCKSSFTPLAEIAAKAIKEVTYHLRHSSELVLRLGGSTSEAHAKMQNAVDYLWDYTDELFHTPPVLKPIFDSQLGVDFNSLKTPWLSAVTEHLSRATLRLPDLHPRVGLSGRRGLHSESLGHLLAEMQSVARSFPNAEW